MTVSRGTILTLLANFLKQENENVSTIINEKIKIRNHK